MQLASSPGAGTTVTILLPRCAGEPPPAVAPRPAGPAPGRGQTILLAEDQPEVQSLLTHVLHDAGYAVLPCATAAEALAHCAAGQPRIDLLLTDLVLPDRDGRELAAAAAALRPGLRISYMSGYAGGRAAGATPADPQLEIIDKPITPEALLMRVRAALA